MNEFNHGPFTASPAPIDFAFNGKTSRRWTLKYGARELASTTLPDDFSQAQVRAGFLDAIGAFEESARADFEPPFIQLVDFESGEAVAKFRSDDMCGMTPGLIDDRSKYWLRSADRRYSRAVTLTEFAAVAAEHSTPAGSWIAGLLPDACLTSDAESWRAPTAWEIRHVVGEGSFTGVSGAKAAAIVGVSPQNFRKYTARDEASTRQPISFAMWHLLLHKLGVQKA